MNECDCQLDKLLRAAARAPNRPAEPPSPALEAAVLARWRGARNEDDPAPLFLLFRRATVFAMLLMALSGAWNYFGTNNNLETAAMASYAMMQLPP